MLLIAALIGAALGALGGKLADVLPLRRYGLTHSASERARRRRDLALVALSGLIAAGVAHRLGGVDVAPWHRGALFAVNAVLGAAVLTAAAIDVEHMILPDELTLGAAALALLSAPIRHVGGADWYGFKAALVGATFGLVIAHVPKVLYNRLRGVSGAGSGDTKLVIAAGAWHGFEGAFFVLVAAALQSAIAAALLRALGVEYAVPESVRAQLAELRSAAAGGDREAQAALDDDPMAEDAIDGVRGMRVPLGPFLALACVEVLFLRRWLVEHVFAWFWS